MLYLPQQYFQYLLCMNLVSCLIFHHLVNNHSILEIILQNLYVQKRLKVFHSLRMKKKTIQQFHGEGRNLEKNHEDFLGTGSVCLAAVESPRRAGGRLLGSSGPGHRWGTAQGTGLAGRILQAGAVYT